jgi:hypothetical protein
MKNQLLSTAYGHSRKSLEQSLSFSRENTLIRGIGGISVSWQKSKVDPILAGFTMTWHNLSIIVIQLNKYRYENIDI